MKHARLRQVMVRTLIFISAITTLACNSSRQTKTLGEPMVESARTVKKEEPKIDKDAVPVKTEIIGQKDIQKQGEPIKLESVSRPLKERKKATPLK